MNLSLTCYHPRDEYNKAHAEMVKWYKAYPKMYLCWGNHDLLPQRKGKSAGLSSNYLKAFRDAWGLPRGWERWIQIHY